MNQCINTDSKNIKEPQQKYRLGSPEYSHPNNIESHIINWITLHVHSYSTTATAFSGHSFQP